MVQSNLLLLFSLLFFRSSVMPDILTDKAISAVDEYPDKRIIVHYMPASCPLSGS